MLTLNLDIHRGLDKVSRVNRSIGDDAGVVAGGQTVCDDNWFHIPHERIRPGLGRTEKTEIIHTVQRKESRDTGLVDGASDGSEGRCSGVGDTIGESGDDTGLALSEDSGRDEGGKEGRGEHTDGHVEDRESKLRSKPGWRKR